MAESTVKYIHSSKIVSTFNGWHISGNSVLDGKTASAVACGKLRDRIIENLESTFGRAKIVQIRRAAIGTDDDPKARCESMLMRPTALGMHAASEKKFAMYKPVTVWVRGPLLHSVPTLCSVRGIMITTEVNDIITAKVLRELRNEYTRWKESRGVGNEYASDFRVEDSCRAMTWATNNSNTPHSFDNIFAVNYMNGLVTRVARDHYATNIANMMLAGRVQHACETDGGTQFRDKMGLTAARNEMSASVNCVLYAPS